MFSCASAHPLCVCLHRCEGRRISPIRTLTRVRTHTHPQQSLPPLVMLKIFSHIAHDAYEDDDADLGFLTLAACESVYQLLYPFPVCLLSRLSLPCSFCMRTPLPASPTLYMASCPSFYILLCLPSDPHFTSLYF